MFDEEQLERQMLALRKDMEQVAQKKGLTDPYVLQISQQIDVLHNQLNQIMCRRQNTETRPDQGTYTHKKGDLHPQASSDARISGRFHFVKEMHIPYGHDRSVSKPHMIVL